MGASKRGVRTKMKETIAYKKITFVGLKSH